MESYLKRFCYTIMGKGDYMKSKNVIKIYSLFILLIAIIFLQLTFVSAIESLGTFKQNDCIQLMQICSNCSYNNISSVLYPNSTQALGQVVMIKIGTNFVYTFCNTSMLGNYIVNGYGDVEGLVTVWAYNFEVTTTGNSNNNTIPLFLALGGFIMFIIAILTRNLYIGFISGTFFIVLGIYLMIFGLGTMADFYTNALSYFALGFGLLIMLSAAYEAIADTGTTLWKKGGGDDDEDF